MDLVKAKLHQEGTKVRNQDQGFLLKVSKEVKCLLYRRLPKRGFKSLNKKNIAVLNLSKIQNIVDKSSNKIKDILDLKTLKEKTYK